MNQELHHTGELMKTALKKNQHHNLQKRNFHFAEVRDQEIFQEKHAEDLLHQLLSDLLKLTDQLILTLLSEFSQHAWELTQMFQRQTAPTEEHLSAMVKEQMVPQERDADLHFQCVNGIPLQAPMVQRVFRELIAKLLLSQLVEPKLVEQLVLIALLELQVHQSHLLKKNTPTSTSSQLAQIDSLSTANQSALKVKQLDALKSEPQLHCQ